MVQAQTMDNAAHKNLNAIFVSVELSKKTWLITSISPGAGEKLSRHSLPGGDIAGLLARLRQLKQNTRGRTGADYSIITIQEAGFDGFWVHRVLEAEGHESHVVDAASIATSRRRRRVKTDRLDGETLIRALLAFKRGEPRVCSMLCVPTPAEEDRRRIVRERKILMEERIRHSNRIKGLLFSQGITGYDPLRRDRRERLEALRTGDGRALADHMKRQILRELGRLEMLLEQVQEVETERNALLEEEAQSAHEVAMLSKVVGIGPEFAAVLWGEGLFRHFDNRRQVAAYAGLAPTPWQSGSIDREQGIGKSGNARLRFTMVEMAWLWLRHQPASGLSRWFNERVAQNGGRFKKVMITALARKLVVALWKYVNAGVVIDGAIIRP
ncbi:IS110 family transposase [Rhizobium mongolense]|uniref:Transposase n=2 Tax=Rhizobium mongolense TaxID=57676 RepID=A0A559TJW9_9HYPH|nr:IS110 family transposase [Rhizobium mongolense]MBB4233438.1 transposase [Rhizobium mongolense]TVZ74897.1 transposase [Rhizobium mongolense USDA 1844]TVZ74903.1 transposase [Rhizobium mongolense USDA 1844]TVZ74942.1 transposase [Rhizobium mongolense USDA 1844]